jgi:diguanylate cyclase (GGDEF)-like protein
LRTVKEDSIALHFIDMDRFKSVNDSLGHDVGDELIKSVSARLQSLAGQDDLVARFGGDEFVMAQTRLTSVLDAGRRAAQIKDALSLPMSIGEHRFKATASIGVAIAPRDGGTPTTLMRAADLAVYCAKAEGRDGWKMYDADMDVALKHRQRIERSLLRAVAMHGFELHYQPIVRSDDRTILGIEVLLRLKAADGENIEPTDFIPIAEEMGLICEIGAFVLRKACATAATWPDSLTVAVNLSPRQFEGGDLIGIVEQALEESGLPPKRLELEITEGLLLSDSERVISQLHQLKALGVSIAMDDFGTGYSSLSYLWRFPFDKLKIDQSFMRVLSEDDPNIASILKTIVSLGRTLNLRVTAEGVETEEQARVLKKLKCDQLQGYHFGKPMPETDLAAVIFRHMLPKTEDDAVPAIADRKASPGPTG